MSEALKLGIIGCGWVTELFHLPASSKVATADVVAAADEDHERLTRVAERFRIPRRYDDHQTLLEDPEVEAVLVWLPADRQAEVASDVLAAGKHLILDKPLVLDLEVWDRLLEQGRRAGRRILVVGFPRRQHPLLRRARAVVEQGTLGPVQYVRTVLTGRNAEHRTMTEVGDRHQWRGLLYEFGIHHFDVLETLVPDAVETVLAVSSADESTYVVNARLAGGAMMCSTFAEGETHNDEVEIYGREGRLLVSCYRFDGFEYFPSTVLPGDPRTRATQVLRSMQAWPRALAHLRRGGDFADSYRAGWQAAVDDILLDGAAACTLAQVRGALRTFLAARRSLELGEPVHLTRA
jgi:predicted dehydrogenase